MTQQEKRNKVTVLFSLSHPLCVCVMHIQGFLTPIWAVFSCSWNCLVFHMAAPAHNTEWVSEGHSARADWQNLANKLCRKKSEEKDAKHSVICFPWVYESLGLLYSNTPKREKKKNLSDSSRASVGAPKYEKWEFSEYLLWNQMAGAWLALQELLNPLYFHKWFFINPQGRRND